MELKLISLKPLRHLIHWAPDPSDSLWGGGKGKRGGKGGNLIQSFPSAVATSAAGENVTSVSLFSLTPFLLTPLPPIPSPPSPPPSPSSAVNPTAVLCPTMYREHFISTNTLYSTHTQYTNIQVHTHTPCCIVYTVSTNSNLHSHPIHTNTPLSHQVTSLTPLQSSPTHTNTPLSHYKTFHSNKTNPVKYHIPLPPLSLTNILLSHQHTNILLSHHECTV